MNNMRKEPKDLSDIEAKGMRRPRRRRFKLLIIVLVIIVIWKLLCLLSSWSTWKAVFLDNNQVFFGKFISVPFSSHITVHKVYYIKTENASTTNSNDVVIAPLSDMVHGPKNSMVISKSHILYYEPLRADTAFVKGLNQEQTKR